MEVYMKTNENIPQPLKGARGTIPNETEGNACRPSLGVQITYFGLF